MPATNSLVWREDDVYWRLSTLAPGSGGAYSAEDLLWIARDDLIQD